MMTNARDERGFVLVSAIMIMLAVMGFGLGMLMLTNGQQRAASTEQTNEAAFELAEAALNAQITQLSHKWPGTEAVGKEYPESGCTEATYTATNGCPSPTSLNAGYPVSGSTSCPASTPGDAWGSPTTNRWTTYVRNDKGGSSYFNSTEEKKEPSWDKEDNKKLWVRSVGVAHCQVITLVTLVSQQFVTLNFPRNAMTGNSFETGNSGGGSGAIINRQGKAAEAGAISMRCNGKSKANCEVYTKGQIYPEPNENFATPSPLLSSTQLEELKAEAESLGTYYPSGKCPSSLPSASLVYVEGPCEVTTGGNETINSEASPGFLIIANGTFYMGGTSTFYGVVYDLNRQESSGTVVTLKGNVKLVGAIDVDGNGSIDPGDSHKGNVEFDPAAIENLKVNVGVAPTRNSFRVLPTGQ